MPSLLISRIYEFSKSGPATSTSTTISFEPGKVSLLYAIWSWKIPVVILWYSIYHRDRNGVTEGTGEGKKFLLLLWLASKQGRLERKETTAALAGKSEIATLLIDLHGHGWLHLMSHFWFRTLWTRSPHDMTERCHQQARKSIDLSLPKEMESGINFSFYL